MRTDGRLWHIRQHKPGEPQHLGISSAKGVTREALVASIDASSLLGNPRAERCWPAALHKVVSVVEEKNTRIIEVRANPNRRMQRGSQTVSGFYRGNKPLLESQRRGQP